jgi:hypothetical protein
MVDVQRRTGPPASRRIHARHDGQRQRRRCAVVHEVAQEGVRRRLGTAHDRVGVVGGRPHRAGKMRGDALSS